MLFDFGGRSNGLIGFLLFFFFFLLLLRLFSFSHLGCWSLRGFFFLFILL
jgi:hypothetical protein